jgi:hypothetical protein
VNQLSEDDRRFLERRRMASKAWPYLRVILIVAILGVAAFLYIRSPSMLNPFETAQRIKAGTLEPGTIRLMASLLPMMFWLCLIVLAVAVIVMESAAAQERRYLSIAKKMQKEE